jgi:putative NIF3 family GTP cyclohydrolase 1 type 2
VISTTELVDLSLELSGMDTLPADSAVYVEGEGLTRILFGIDIGAAELLLARELGCDGVIAHHPAGGSATLHFPEVLARQIELMVAHGVPEDQARDAVQPLVTRATMSAHAANHDHAPSVARALGLPFLNIHLPLDELGRVLMATTVNDYVATLDREPLVQDVIDALDTMPEFSDAPTRIMVPVGAVDNSLGRIAVVHGAGTNGGTNVARAYFDNGIETVLYIHCSGEDVMRLREDARGNLIVSGHIASDMVGINPYVREIESRGVEVVRFSGL